MTEKNYKEDFCNLTLALVGAINENIISVSFDYEFKNKIKLKLVFKEYGDIEHEITDDIISEFSAISGYLDYHFSNAQIVFVNEKEKPLKHLVYKKYFVG